MKKNLKFHEMSRKLMCMILPDSDLSFKSDAISASLPHQYLIHTALPGYESFRFEYFSPTDCTGNTTVVGYLTPYMIPYIIYSMFQSLYVFQGKVTK